MTVKYFQFVDTKTFCAPQLLSLSHSLPLSLVVSFSFGLSIYCYWLLAPVGNLLTENKSFWSSECQTFKWRTFFPSSFFGLRSSCLLGCPLVGLRQGVQFIRLDLCATLCINVWALITFPSVSLSLSLNSQIELLIRFVVWFFTLYRNFHIFIILYKSFSMISMWNIYFILVLLQGLTKFVWNIQLVQKRRRKRKEKRDR